MKAILCSDSLWHNATNRIPILVLLSARAISLTGDELALLAVPWFVLQTTGNAVQAGIVGAATVLPRIVSGIFGGTLVDRLGFKQTSVIADLMSGVTVALIPLLHSTIGITFWQILLLVFLGSLLDNAGNVARSSLIPDLSALANMRLERANAAFGSVNSATILVGPLAAGLLIAVLGPTEVLWIDAATFILSATLVITAVPAPLRSENQSKMDGPYLAQLAEGVTFVLRDRMTLALLIIGTGVNALIGPLFAVILPVFAIRIYGDPVDLGFMIGAVGAGTLVGTLAFGALGHKFARKSVLIGSFAGIFVSLSAISLTPRLLAVIAILTILGLFRGPLNPLLGTIFMERVPKAMRGRFFGLMTATASAATPLGMFIAGFLLETVELRGTLMIWAVASFMLTMAVFIHPLLQALDERA